MWGLLGCGALSNDAEIRLTEKARCDIFYNRQPWQSWKVKVMRGEERRVVFV